MKYFYCNLISIQKTSTVYEFSTFIKKFIKRWRQNVIRWSNKHVSLPGIRRKFSKIIIQLEQWLFSIVAAAAIAAFLTRYRKLHYRQNACIVLLPWSGKLYFPIIFFVRTSLYRPRSFSARNCNRLRQILSYYL